MTAQADTLKSIEWQAWLRSVASQAVQVVREAHGRPVNSTQDCKVEAQVERLLGEITPTANPVFDPPAIGKAPDSIRSEAVSAVALALTPPETPASPPEDKADPAESPAADPIVVPSTDKAA